MKKILSVLAALALVGTLAFAQDAENVESAETVAAEETSSGSAFFNNTVHTDTVVVNADGASFAGMYEEMEAGYNSDILDIYAKGRIILNEEYANFIGYDHSETRFGIKYKPLAELELGIGQAYYIPGSYMAVEDDNVAIGNIGTAGFNLAYKPLSGLTFVASFDFVSGVYNNYIYDAAGNYIFNTGFGGWYEFVKDGEEDPFFTVGAAFEYNRNGDVDNPYHAGIYASCAPVAGLSLYAGYTYNAPEGDLYIEADHAINFSASYEAGDFYCGADYNTDMGENLYTGVLFGYVVEDFDISLCATAVAEYEAFAEGEFCIAPGCTWQINDNHSFGFGVDINFAGGAWDSIDIPLEWCFSL
ncbi:MAG: hypothetical protein K6G52_06445 [Treponemataceae bacterium]|nr:hypothetical protein [Treponemataceae bacterium]